MEIDISDICPDLLLLLGAPSNVYDANVWLRGPELMNIYQDIGADAKTAFLSLTV